ncbi:MAG: hypothetical protein AVO35_04380 [Candidatus Aegiribacteria sp. MLS_C]|nr:MAG: hypothetical protein AVO35_04380 [Candidatus Aegiribacteria sp. MLS_C]
MHWLLTWMMLFSTADDPASADPGLRLRVDGELLPEYRTAFVVIPGDTVTLTLDQGAQAGWSFTAGTPGSGSGSSFGWRAPRGHGIYHMDVSTSEGTYKYSVIVPVETCRWRTTTLNSFPIGSYGDGNGMEDRPDWFIEMDAAGSGTRITTHLTLGDFLGHVEGSYPQYLALDLRLADKMEELFSAVSEVYPQASSIYCLSGFRTPAYNAAIGNETSESLHLYGMAADIWIESWPANGLMDDIDRNKRVDVYDGEYLVELVRTLEVQGRVVTGGASAYRWIPTHGPFVHIDTRGSRAVWPTCRNLVENPVI